MSSGKPINVLLDRELYMALENHAAQAGLTISQATRDLLRHALGVVTSTKDAGWREGYQAAVVSVHKAVVQAISSISSICPGENQ
jgi:hypothetical protein